MKASKAFSFALLASLSVMACSSVHAADTASETPPGAVAAPAAAAAAEPTRFEKCQQQAKDLVATQNCLAEEQKAVEKELDETVAKAAAAAAATDKDVPGYDVAKKLEAATASFRKYMEDQCAYEMAVYTNGSLAGAAKTACITTLTKQRNDLIGPDQFSPDASSAAAKQ